MSSAPQVSGVEVRGEWRDRYEGVLTAESLGLLARLQREFGPRRAELLQRRAAHWRVALPAAGLVDRRVEITVGEQAFAAGGYEEAREPFEQVALADDFVEFLTLPAYERLAG